MHIEDVSDGQAADADGTVWAGGAATAYIHGTINGMGERAGNANLGEVALALRALYGVETKLPSSVAGQERCQPPRCHRPPRR